MALSVLSPQTAGFGFAPALPKFDSAQTLADLKPLSIGQSQVRFEAAPAWKITSSQPELVAKGVEEAVSGISKGVLAAYQKKAEEDTKLEIRTRELAEKLQEKRDKIAADQADPARLLLIESRRLENQKLQNELDNRKNAVFGSAADILTKKADTIEQAIPRSTEPVDKSRENAELDKAVDDLRENEISQMGLQSLSLPQFSRDFTPSIFAENIFSNIASSGLPKTQTQDEVSQFASNIQNIDPKYLLASTGGGVTPPAPMPSPTPAKFDIGFDPRTDIFTNVLPDTAFPPRRLPVSTPIRSEGVVPARGELAQMNFPVAKPATPPVTAPTPTAAPSVPVGRYFYTPETASEEAGKGYEGYAVRGQVKYKDDVINPVASQIAGYPVKGVWVVDRDVLSPTELEKQRQGAGPRPEYTKEQGEQALSLRKALVGDSLYQSARELSKKYDAVETGLLEGNGFGDIAAINAFQKMIDEGVAVREGDVELMRSAQSFLSKWSPEQWADKAVKGKILTPPDEEAMRRMASKLTLLSKKAANREAIPFYKNTAQRVGLKWEDIAQDFDVTPTRQEVESEIKSNRDKAAALLSQKTGSKNPEQIQRQVDALSAASKKLLEEYQKGKK
jgi:hypothetical protein